MRRLAPQRKLATLDFDTESKLTQGEDISRNLAGCATCHDPDAPDHPFTDNRGYGRGAGWLGMFVTTYESDPRLTELLPDGLPAPVLARGRRRRRGAQLETLGLYVRPME